MEHTEGKWIVKHDPFGTFDVEYRTKDGGGLICVCGTDEESKANAKLIAAAPKLLDACKEVFGASIYRASQTCYELPMEAMRIVEAAIADII